MKIIDLKHIEIANNGLVVNEIVFDACITNSFIDYLSAISPEANINQGNFRLSISNGAIITGHEGENSIKIIFSSNAKHNLHQLIEIIDAYSISHPSL